MITTRLLVALLVASLGGGVAGAMDQATLAKKRAEAAEKKTAATASAGWSVLQVRASQPCAVFQDGEPIQLSILFDRKIVGTYRIARVRCAGQLEDKEKGAPHVWASRPVELAEVARGSLPELRQEEAVKGSSPAGYLWALEPKINRNGGVYYTTQMRSSCKRNGPSWHPDAMVDSWSIETPWAFEK